MKDIPNPSQSAADNATLLVYSKNSRTRSSAGLYRKLLCKVRTSRLSAATKKRLVRLLKALTRVCRQFMVTAREVAADIRRNAPMIRQRLQQLMAAIAYVVRRLMDATAAYPITTAGFIVGLVASAIIPPVMIIGPILKTLAMVIPVVWGLFEDLKCKVAVWFQRMREGALV